RQARTEGQRLQHGQDAQVLPELLAARVERVTLTGGEPFVDSAVADRPPPPPPRGGPPPRAPPPPPPGPLPRPTPARRPRPAPPPGAGAGGRPGRPRRERDHPRPQIVTAILSLLSTHADHPS